MNHPIKLLNLINIWKYNYCSLNCQSGMLTPTGIIISTIYWISWSLFLSVLLSLFANQSAELSGLYF